MRMKHWLSATMAFMVVGVAQAQLQDARVGALLDEAQTRYEVDGDGDYVLGFRLPNGRTQRIWINSNTERYDAMEIREVWSPAYLVESELSGAVAQQLLRQNANVKLGAWHVADMFGTQAAIFSVKVPADADGATLMTVLEAVTMTADLMDLELNGDDDF